MIKKGEKSIKKFYFMLDVQDFRAYNKNRMSEFTRIINMLYKQARKSGPNKSGVLS